MTSTKTLARFTFHGNHIITFTRTSEGHFSTCETCSLPAVIAKAVAFMYGNSVHAMTIDGAELKRI